MAPNFLSKRINPATGEEIEWSDTQKKNIIQVEGGPEMRYPIQTCE